MKENRSRFNTMIGLATIGSTITGVASLCLALISLFDGDFLAMGTCLIAAALSFGLLANALLRT